MKKEDLWTFPLYILMHPIDGFDEFKRYKRGKLYVAITFLVLMALLSILKYQYTGFIVNENNPQDLNSIKEIAYILAPLLIFVIGNWSVTTLLDGKGKLKEIFMMTCYALFPMIVIGYINIIISNIVSIPEADFYYLFNGFGIFLTAYMLFIGLIVIHEYTLMKSLLTILFTIVAMGVLIFIGLLFFDLIQQIFGFLYAIIKEISLRYF
ncbi:YIP1 family protein [Haloplasma contractile]|uniref:NHL repeat containing protein n=1 Tax=Haloplasma contractile SSD-17B TaxID=1033810 RepID=F7PUD3_9MOLU|nr:YIP1 family protein [Haloplasma contractile]ERJ11738.1 NHL repeat containing protein [Haloplasma contractile SSD-17B]